MSDRFHVATRKGVFTIQRKPHGWGISQTSFLGDQCSMVMHDARPWRENGSSGEETLYAALGHGHFGVKMHRSRNGGASWQEVTTPAYPPKPEDQQPKKQPAEGRVYDWVLQLVWALSPGGRNEEGTLWCGTLPGGLFKSEDHGQTWELNRPLWDDPRREEWFGGGADFPGIHSVCVDPRDPQRIILGISCGGAWITRDGGRTWSPGGKGMRAEYMPPERAYDENVQDPHLVAMCPNQPDALWVQHHNGIFKSTDGAANWSEIQNVQPSAFGFAVAVHPRNPEIAWFVPAIKDEKRIPASGKVVVTRTTDGGRSFEQLTKGLPQEHAYDLVFRHALDVDETGNRLVFGSTTGSLWVSENGGNSWAAISHHLPPVYAVRFEKPLA